MAKKESKSKRGRPKKDKSAPLPPETQSQTMAEQEQHVVDAGGTLESAFDPTAEAKPKRKPRQAKLPGVSEPLTDLETLAEQFAEVTDERKVVRKKELSLRDEILQLMHKHRRDSYQRDGISITVQHKEERVKVKITKPEEIGASSSEAEEAA